MDFKVFVKDYTFKLNKLMDNIDLDAINEFYETILNLDSHSTIYIMGNGGSSSTASHMANDLAVGLKIRKIKDLKVYSLSDNSAITYAISNDTGFENVFYMQLKNILKPNDIVVAFSCSGNSPNIIKAIEYAKDIKCKTIGLTGFDGGKLSQLSDINIHFETQKNEYGLVEDAHGMVNHIIFSYFEQKGKNESKV